MSAESELKTKFTDEFLALTKVKSMNSGFMNAEQYKATIETVKAAKVARKKTPKDYRRIKRFDIRTENGVERLITPISTPQTGECDFKYFVSNDEMFDIIHETHLAIGHAGRTRMITELHKKYKNITQEIVAIYLTHCTVCQIKLKTIRRWETRSGQPEFSRCIINILNMQANPDGQYRFILYYQESTTKFVQLRALTTKTEAEVVSNILDIFCITGAPMILESNISLAFNKNVISELNSNWPELKLVTGKYLKYMDEEHLKKLLRRWMLDNQTESWSKGLKFVQLSLNLTYYEEIKITPYKAMFGTDIKIGLLDSQIPMHLISNITTEDELLAVAEDIPLETPSEEVSKPEFVAVKSEVVEDIVVEVDESKCLGYADDEAGGSTELKRQSSCEPISMVVSGRTKEQREVVDKKALIKDRLNRKRKIAEAMV